MSQKLERTTFVTSRAMDFFSEKELTTQTGSPIEDWPLVVLKELVDNALDACEDAGIVPEIRVVVDSDSITVSDNGPGIPPATVAGALDFSVRVSSREAYVAPDRGAQGNALKTVIAMPFVLDGAEGRVTICGRGIRHEIKVSVDPIRQVPAIVHEEDLLSDAVVGTTVTVRWPDSPWSQLPAAEARFLQLAEDYAFLNPHLSLTVDWFGQPRVATEGQPGWKKWLPSEPTSAHWYGDAEFERLVAAYVAHDADAGTTRSVREFVTEFRGLSATAKQKAILENTGLARTNLGDLANGHIDSARVGELLAAMKASSKPPKPAQLGFIGKDHLTARLLATGAEAESIEYVRKVGSTDDGVPWVVETAFGWCPDLDRRRLVMGVNWSPALGNPFRELGAVGRSLDAVLTSQRAMEKEPVAFVIHMAHARVRYTDRGKSAVVIGR